MMMMMKVSSHHLPIPCAVGRAAVRVMAGKCAGGRGSVRESSRAAPVTCGSFAFKLCASKSRCMLHDKGVCPVDKSSS